MIIAYEVDELAISFHAPANVTQQQLCCSTQQRNNLKWAQEHHFLHITEINHHVNFTNDELKHHINTQYKKKI